MLAAANWSVCFSSLASYAANKPKSAVFLHQNVFSALNRLLANASRVCVAATPFFSRDSLQEVSRSPAFTSQLVELVAAATPFLMQMCANRKHCSSAWLPVSVTPLSFGLSPVPPREMFLFKFCLFFSFETSSPLLTNRLEERELPRGALQGPEEAVASCLTM